MSWDSSQERTEQEQPRSTTSAETDHSPAVQGASGGEQFPSNVTPAPVPPDADEFVALLLSWIRTPDWSTSQTYLQAHPELLTEAPAQVLATLIQHQSDQQIHELLMLHQQLLQIAGQQGVKAAYQALLYQKEKNDSAATEQEELQAHVIAWLLTPDWKTSQTYLQSHPQLLTNAAEQIMEAIKRSQREQQAQEMISLHQALLQEARVEGIEAAYKRFLVSEPEPSGGVLARGSQSDPNRFACPAYSAEQSGHWAARPISPYRGPGRSGSRHHGMGEELVHIKHRERMLSVNAFLGVCGASDSIICSSLMRSRSNACSTCMFITSTNPAHIKGSSSRYQNRTSYQDHQITQVARFSFSLFWVDYIMTTAEVLELSLTVEEARA